MAVVDLMNSMRKKLLVQSAEAGFDLLALEIRMWELLDMMDDATMATSSQPKHKQVSVVSSTVYLVYLLWPFPDSHSLSLHVCQFEHITESSYVCTAQSLSPKIL